MRRRRGAFLCFDFDCDSGLEFHGEVLGEDGDLLDELFDQSLIKLRDVGFLLGDEVLQLLDPVHGLFPVMAVDFGLFFLLPEPENLISDGVVILLVVCFLDELFLELLQPCLNAVRREGISADHGFGDVCLQLFQEGAALRQNLIDGFDRDLLQQELVYRPVLAGHFSVSDFQAADAAPDDGFTAVVIPVDAAVKLTAVSAKNHLGKAVIAGEGALFPGRAGMDDSPADKLGLHLHEQLFRNDGFVVVLDVVLRNDAIVLDALLRQEVRGVGLLKQGVAHVLLVAENLVDGAGVPFFLARAGEDSVCHKPGGYFVHAGAFEVLPVDAFYDFCLLWVYDQVPVLILGVAEKAIVIDVHFSLLETVLKSQLDVLAHGLAFLLGKARHDRKENLSLSVQRVYGLLFKIDRDVLVLELPDVLEAVEGVSGKSADGLGDDHVDVPGHALVDHAVKFIPLFGIGTGYPIISINSSQFPIRMIVNVGGVVLNLRFVAGGLLVVVGRNPAISSHTTFWFFFSMVSV